ncbi:MULTISPECIES: type II toxin-antitoxin system ParD family antitoxin [unclassified Rhizobium]|uniref:type II toxin-antitoxin system ParD family antitoxin n=1 Tax=unclassified Rhizobium TaxID=2613769 RepID=UPI001ADD2414|nr:MULTISPECIES: type II toxin-antitoxin system ParD family antitoxin [unclassified Rhizobium]MBO9097767.1 type II toxin-antitoxin system ParD family antitoxin [Rhizobium sp. L58/93]MBO9133451.1 type II toxin-antitoxin system ParD family antitoxin [Rhizobium sp. B209b/85]MBO9167918.1 type II toxin-antitoxin system ParD family antitoxin [Rhizobium sp. L245/93]MBO9183962.1 type II toxin-antitoxin system ParD family antitoxin [Rhizobium sp. E27B/91]QXZ84195.1 type II toxin-antitoxin system ParD f
MNQKLSITLPAEMVEAINARVEAGTYGSASEVVQAAIRALVEQDEDYAARISSLRARVQASIDDPRPDLTGAEVKAHIEAFFESRR